MVNTTEGNYNEEESLHRSVEYIWATNLHVPVLIPD